MKHKIQNEAKVGQKASQSSENEESDCTATETSSMSGSLCKKGKKGATQFSVLRSDTDGLRMKISAIRRRTNDSIKYADNNNHKQLTTKLDIKRNLTTNTCMLAPSMSNIPKPFGGKTFCSSLIEESDSEASINETFVKTKSKPKRKKAANEMKSPSALLAINKGPPPSFISESNNKNSNEIKERTLATINQSSNTAPDDNIGLSSSDNELPALVNAAIKCVESDSDSLSICTQPKIQYTSSLLQDFMAKTQMLSAGVETAKTDREPIAAPNKLTTVNNEKDLPVKRKRGRPRKIQNIKVVNESADSGVVSTAQSMSPSPKVQSRPRSQTKVEHRIDLKSLDKRIYTMPERALYPPPKSKIRNHQIGAPKRVVKNASSSLNNKVRTEKTAPLASSKEDSIDPAWREIDVNSKFRRPSVSGYKSDGAGGNTTICSKILAAKNGYTSDYGMRTNHYSGYKSDASGKSRCSMKTCYSRAKSCDGKHRAKVRRKRRQNANHTKTIDHLNEQDILQLAGLSLGQSSEESNESVVCKPKILPEETEIPNVYKKYGEINRYVTTGEYFGRNKVLHMYGHKPFESNSVNQTMQNPYSFLGSISNKLYSRSRKGSLTTGDAHLHSSRKMKSRRSSVASYCSSSFYSAISKSKKRRRRKSTKCVYSKLISTDSKLLTEIEIITNSFATMCRIHCDKSSSGSGYVKDKNNSERAIPQKSLHQNKRNIKKRKTSENVDFVLANGSNTTGKRRHKKQSNSGPDDHKLPLKKRHYLLTPGEKTEKSQDNQDSKVNAQKSSSKTASSKTAVTPKKRHLLQTGTTESTNALHSHVNDTKTASSKMASTENVSIDNGRKRSRLEGVVSKIVHTNNTAHNDFTTDSSSTATGNQSAPAPLNNESLHPPPGVFEPSIELEIQIPITKLAETSVITKSEVQSPLDLEIQSKNLSEISSSTRVVESLLNKTGGNSIFRRKRKKINRTGFPSVKRKKIKMNETSFQSSSDQVLAIDSKVETVCDRVPQTGEASSTFLERNRTPRLSVVSLDRLQGTSRKSQSLSDDAKLNRTRSLKLSGNAKGQKELETRRARKANPVKLLAKPLSKRKEMINSSEDPVKVAISPNLHITFPVCKIRLKRRLAAVTKDKTLIPNQSTEDDNKKDCTKSLTHKKLVEPAKRTDSETVDFLEQEPLPAAFCDIGNTNDSESSSSVSVLSEDSKSTNRKQKWKKNYLIAGLLSDHYKANNSNVKKKKMLMNQTKENIIEPVSPIIGPLLPPPPYCEKFFRRSQVDFQLPYDIWWAYTNDKLPSRVTVPSWNYRKIRTNVYRCPDIRPNAANIDRPTCNCKANLGCGDDCLNRMVYTECYPSSCPTGEKCQNQKIQRHEVAPGVERFMTENKGWGVRTTMPIKKGTYILEYVGEVVTEKEFKERMATLYVNDTHHYCLHLDGGLVIDGHRMGSDGRFVNHSCSPNCEMQKWSVNGLSRMALFAARNIDAGEELCYDYNFSLFNPSEGQECRCNTPQCRGVIGGKSQRIKPLIEQPKPVDMATGGVNNGRRNGRQRKRQGSSRKDVVRLHSKDIVITQLLQQLTEKDKRLVKTQRIFLIRSFEKVRRIKSRSVSLKTKKVENPASLAVQRRPSTPSSLAVQISALRSPRNIQTRGLTQAVHDPEVEKMAKMAVIFRNICSALESIKDPSDKPQICKLYNNLSKRKGKQTPQQQGNNTPKRKTVDFPTIQINIEKGFYKDPIEFDSDMKDLFIKTRELNKEDAEKLEILKQLCTLYAKKKNEVYNQLVELVTDRSRLKSFRPIVGGEIQPTGVVSKNFSAKSRRFKSSTEDIIDCICGLYKDEGLMIQCARCMVWQHTECTKADINADSYLCEKCEPRIVDREITLDEFTDDGCRYYLSLMRGDLQIRQGDAVYVLRDIPIKDDKGNVTKKHTYETIGEIDYSECDIFRVERLWKDKSGKRVVFGHHFLRPHETFHEPSRRFYPNEVVRVPLYEVVPIDLIIGRCWVLDRTTYCKGRPADCTSEDHVFICELRVDKSARFFSKAKINWPTCTKSYAFKKFDEKLKVAKTYAPHDVDPSLMKFRRPRTAVTGSSTPTSSPKSTHSVSRTNVHDTLTAKKHKRNHLEKVITAIIKLNSKNTHPTTDGVMDVSYLLSGRGARQRKPTAASVPM